MASVDNQKGSLIEFFHETPALLEHLKWAQQEDDPERALANDKDDGDRPNAGQDGAKRSAAE